MESTIGSDLRVLVVGAGLAGLATALALHRRGIGVELVERQRRWEDGGAGLFLPANAVRALGHLGLDAPGRPVRRQRLHDRNGRRLADLDVSRIWPGMGDSVGVHRASLHRVLRRAARDIPVRMGTTVQSIRDGDAPLVHASDGSRRTYHLVIGADGVHSAVRDLVFGGPRAEPVGQMCWRFVVRGRPDIIDWNAWLGPRRSFLAVALEDDQVYCYADIAQPETPDWRAEFAGFAEPVGSLIAAAGVVHRAPIEQVAPPTWIAHRVLLVGDAAHASPPNMAQGAAMSFEDALVLAELLSAAPLTEALTEYERRRTPRATWVQQQARERDRTRTMPSFARNTILRIAAPRLFARSYRPLLAPP
ncbi:FAD-dependent monooxygenase [Paractinoplanes rhizophilus]|uniref:FAD-dependent monooxygenase n=1 Tax=Paractinoplanes rhizophilus TaxID=1416877 RepID=A0ABW2I2W0_9ACTN